MRRAQGIEDIGLGEAVKTYYPRYFPAGFLILVAATVGGALAFPGTPDKWPTFLAIGFLLGVLGALIGALVYNRRKWRLQPSRDGSTCCFPSRARNKSRSAVRLQGRHP